MLKVGFELYFEDRNLHVYLHSSSNSCWLK